MEAISGVGAAQAFSRMQETQQVQGNAQVQQQQMQQVQQQADQRRAETVNTSGQKVGGTIYAVAWAYCSKNRFFGNDFSLKKK